MFSVGWFYPVLLPCWQGFSRCLTSQMDLKVFSEFLFCRFVSQYPLACLMYWLSCIKEHNFEDGLECPFWLLRMNYFYSILRAIAEHTSIFLYIAAIINICPTDIFFCEECPTDICSCINFLDWLSCVSSEVLHISRIEQKFLYFFSRLDVLFWKDYFVVLKFLI